MERPFPPPDLPKGDKHGGHRRLGHLYCPLNGGNAIDQLRLTEDIPIRLVWVQGHQELLTAFADKEFP